MKTISSPSEYDDVLSSNGGVVTSLPSKIEDNHQGHNNIYSSPKCEKKKSKNLIICNSNLASGLDRIKLEKLKVSPGHYIQKVLFNNSATHKIKSQSLPSCVDNTQTTDNIQDSECSKSCSIDATESNLVLESCVQNINVTKVSNNDNRFNTWPERGTDKKHSTPSDCSNLNVDNNIVANEDTHHIKDDIQLPCKTECVRENSVSIDSVLKSIPPLGYSPLTKKLHVIQSTTNFESHNSVDVKCSDNATSKQYTKTLGSNLPLKDCVRSKDAQDDIAHTNSNVTSTNVSLNRVATDASCCSYSSTISSLSDVSPSTNEDSALGSLVALDAADNCSLASIGECSILSEDNLASNSLSNNKQKKKSISGFFSRSVFAWKSCNNEGSTSHGEPWLDGVSNNSSTSGGLGWKIFSRSNAQTDSRLNQSDYESGGGSAEPGSPCSVRSSGSASCNGKVHGHESIVASSSALIQLDRPACLPAKSRLESEKHRQQYLDMVDAAKRKELKEAKQRQRQLQLQLKVEEQQAQAARTWSHDVLPKWEAVCNSRKTKDLWWLGIPPCVRGKVWRLAITNELNLTQQLYEICCERAREMLNSNVITGDETTDNKEASVQLIQLDISRTFPNLCIFQQGGPYYDMLHCLLGAYVCYRPDVGYVQGMSFIAAVLILNMDVSDAFICFANLLNRPCHMAFFSLNQSMMQAYYATYNDLFSENLPRVYKHFVDSNLTPDLYLLDWIYTVFAKAMNLDLASRVWDVFLRDGEQFLFRAALGVLHMCQDTLLKMDFIHGAQYLTRLPDDLPPDQLFKSIASIKMLVGKQNYEQILSTHSN